MTIEFHPRPSMRVIQQIAGLERFAGSWERLSQVDALASAALQEDAIKRGSAAALALDLTSPAGVVEIPGETRGRYQAILVEKGAPIHSPINGDAAKVEGRGVHYALDAMIRAHNSEAAYDPAGIGYLYELLTSCPQSPAPLDVPPEGIPADLGLYRRTAAHFLSATDKVVFPTVSAFLIPQRLDELVHWTCEELAEEHLHPLLVIGTFHLLFLQISPFAVGCHRLACVLTWRLLAENGFGFVRYSHFTPVWRENSTQYFNALRQAEKTARGNWSTVNIWLEFFLDSLLESSRTLAELSDQKSKNFRLSGVQKKIIEVVKSYGAATRETIVRETGINMSTVKYNLSILSQRGQLRRDGAGRTTNYRLI